VAMTDTCDLQREVQRGRSVADGDRVFRADTRCETPLELIDQRTLRQTLGTQNRRDCGDVLLSDVLFSVGQHGHPRAGGQAACV